MDRETHDDIINGDSIDFGPMPEAYYKDSLFSVIESPQTEFDGATSLDRQMGPHFESSAAFSEQFGEFADEFTLPNVEFQGRSDYAVESMDFPSHPTTIAGNPANFDGNSTRSVRNATDFPSLSASSSNVDFTASNKHMVASNPDFQAASNTDAPTSSHTDRPLTGFQTKPEFQSNDHEVLGMAHLSAQHLSPGLFSPPTSTPAIPNSISSNLASSNLASSNLASPNSVSSNMMSPNIVSPNGNNATTTGTLQRTTLKKRGSINGEKSQNGTVSELKRKRARRGPGKDATKASSSMQQQQSEVEQAQQQPLANPPSSNQSPANQSLANQPPQNGAEHQGTPPDSNKLPSGTTAKGLEIKKMTDVRARACDDCRRRKTACYYLNSETPKCFRCQMENIECTFSARTRAGSGAGAGSHRPQAIPQRGAPRTLPAGVIGPIEDYSQLPGRSLLKKTLSLQHPRSSFAVGQHGLWDQRVLESITLDKSNQARVSSNLSLRKVGSDSWFMIRNEGGQSDWVRDCDEIERTVYPYGRSLVNAFFMYFQPEYPVLHEKIFVEKYMRTYRELMPALLGSVYLLGMRWWSHNTELATVPRPDHIMPVLYDLVLTNFFKSSGGSSLSLIQAGLLLLQCSQSDTRQLSICAVINAAALRLALNRNCLHWKLPRWEINLRLRLSWATYSQSTWISLFESIPPLIHDNSWFLATLNADMFDCGTNEPIYNDALFIHLNKLSLIVHDMHNLLSSKLLLMYSNRLVAQQSMANNANVNAAAPSMQLPRPSYLSHLSLPSSSRLSSDSQHFQHTQTTAQTATQSATGMTPQASSETASQDNSQPTSQPTSQPISRTQSATHSRTHSQTHVDDQTHPAGQNAAVAQTSAVNKTSSASQTTDKAPELSQTRQQPEQTLHTEIPASMLSNGAANRHAISSVLAAGSGEDAGSPQAGDMSPNTFAEALMELIKPIQLRLHEWHQALPPALVNIEGEEPSGNFSLRIAYIAAEVTLHRFIIRVISSKSAPAPLDPSITSFLRTSARERLDLANELLKSLRPQHLHQFWYFVSSQQIAVIGVFAALMYTTSASTEEAEYYSSLLKTYIGRIQLFSDNEIMCAALRTLRSSIAGVPGLEFHGV